MNLLLYANTKVTIPKIEFSIVIILGVIKVLDIYGKRGSTSFFVKKPSIK